MRTKLVKRYWCDFCNKAGLSAGAMAKHEKHCTMNPNRECRVCKMVDSAQHSLASLIALLPVPVLHNNEWGVTEFQPGFEDAVMAAIPSLRKEADNCPACIMAALRQAKIPVPIAREFNFTEEMKSILADINAAQAHSESCY